MKMTNEAVHEILWDGPFSWPRFERDNLLRSIPRMPGVYLQAFDYKDGYLIYAAGLSRRPILTRFKEHTRKYMNGEYNVLDLSAAHRGVRQEVWHGWGYARTHRDEFERNKPFILEAVRKQLAGFRIFTANVEGVKETRMLERLEASIMAALYEQAPLISDLPGRGMQLAQRRDSEPPINVENHTTSILHGLPFSLNI